MIQLLWRQKQHQLKVLCLHCLLNHKKSKKINKKKWQPFLKNFLFYFFRIEFEKVSVFERTSEMCCEFGKRSGVRRCHNARDDCGALILWISIYIYILLFWEWRGVDGHVGAKQLEENSEQRVGKVATDSHVVGERERSFWARHAHAATPRHAQGAAARQQGQGGRHVRECARFDCACWSFCVERRRCRCAGACLSSLPLCTSDSLSFVIPRSFVQVISHSIEVACHVTFAKKLTTTIPILVFSKKKKLLLFCNNECCFCWNRWCTRPMFVNNWNDYKATWWHCQPRLPWW